MVTCIGPMKIKGGELSYEMVRRSPNLNVRVMCYCDVPGRDAGVNWCQMEYDGTYFPSGENFMSWIGL